MFNTVQIVFMNSFFTANGECSLVDSLAMVETIEWLWLVGLGSDPTQPSLAMIIDFRLKFDLSLDFTIFSFSMKGDCSPT